MPALNFKIPARRNSETSATTPQKTLVRDLTRLLGVDHLNDEMIETLGKSQAAVLIDQLRAAEAEHGDSLSRHESGQLRLGEDGQPLNTRFSWRRNREKAAYALRGILEGIVADQELGPREVLFLDAWLQSQDRLNSGDVTDLLDMIGEILEDNEVTKEELDELHEVINDTIEFGQQSSDEVEASINELLGLLLGMVSDSELTHEEFEKLDQWLQTNEHIADHWPADEIIEQIRAIREDGVVEQEELDHLVEVLKQLCGYEFEETGAADGGVAEVFSDGDIQVFEHNGRTICFTGKFVCGTRSAVEKVAQERGAATVKNVTGKVNTLVVGTIASRDWRFTSHGRKIEKALTLRKKGKEIVILSERRWRQFTK